MVHDRTGLKTGSHHNLAVSEFAFLVRGRFYIPALLLLIAVQTVKSVNMQPAMQSEAQYGVPDGSDVVNGIDGFPPGEDGPPECSTSNPLGWDSEVWDCTQDRAILLYGIFCCPCMEWQAQLTTHAGAVAGSGARHIMHNRMKQTNLLEAGCWVIVLTCHCLAWLG